MFKFSTGWAMKNRTDRLKSDFIVMVIFEDYIGEITFLSFIRDVFSVGSGVFIKSREDV